MAKTATPTPAASTSLAPVKEALPAHLQGGKTASLGNIDSSDLIIPRVKLLQAISPEVTDHEGAKAGEYWHSLAGETMGKEVRFIPIVIRKSLMLWAPRTDKRGILARSNDCIHWDVKEKFSVKLKGMATEVVWDTTSGLVSESGLAQFGSSVPGDSNSQPAAAVTYNIMGYFPDHPELSPAVILNTRSSTKRAKQLISKIELRPVDHYKQMFVMGITKEDGDEGPYYNYSYTADGYASPEDIEITAALFERFGKAEFRAADEDAGDGGAPGGGAGGTVGGKAGAF